MEEQTESSALSHEHSPEAIRERLSQAREQSYLGDSVLGAIDGAVTTFAVVSGVVGGNLPGAVAVLLGFANLLADGFSMAVSNYEGTKSRKQQADRLREVEKRHIEVAPEGEAEEIRQIFRMKGFEGETLEEIVDVITSDEDLWIDTMLTEEYGMQLEGPTPWKAGLATFVAFCIAGTIPLIPFVVPDLADMTRFAVSSVITGAAFLGIGMMKGRALDQPIIRSGISTLLTGGGAAILAYAVGALLRGVVEGVAL